MCYLMWVCLASYGNYFWALVGVFVVFTLACCFGDMLFGACCVRLILD